MSSATLACPHCQSPVPEGCREAPYCCRGCREVAVLLRDEGLGRYYTYAQDNVLPAQLPTEARSHAWLDPMLEASEAAGASGCRLELDVQGIHCAACVWLMDELGRRQGGGARVTVNPALGKVAIAWEKGRFDVRGFVRAVERFGYQFGPARKDVAPASRSLLMRIGVCAAFDSGVMMFAVPFYLGLAPDEPETFRLFSLLCAVLTGAVAVIGGWPFVKSAFEALRRGIMHLDLPIALGIVLSYGTSLWKFRDGRGDLAYFEAVSSFTTLMLIGRWLQERLIERNRRFLLDDAGADGLQTRREEHGRLQVVPVGDVRAGDVLVIAPGDLVPVDAQALDIAGSFSTDWINGESHPRRVDVGGQLPAGAFNAGREALRIQALTPFEDSPLPALLRATPSSGAFAGRLVDTVARWYVPVVLALAAAGFWLWWPSGADQALDVTVALLVVTCPCAIGIAVPLAHEFALAQLRRQGVLVRAGDLLPRALELTRVLFDKTGTLTLGRLELAQPAALTRLAPDALSALNDMASRSNHPVSRCLANELARVRAPFTAAAQVHEVPGAGVELLRGGHSWRLGKPGWASTGAAANGAAVLGRDGETIAEFVLEESIRNDARSELAALAASGLEVWLVSGDAPEKVAQTAKLLGIPPERALASQTPEDKAKTVERLGAATTLFVGDGVNDSLAFAAARATASPAVDRPVMPGKADFFLLGESIGGVRALLDTARRLHAVERQLLFAALAYNVLAVAVCFSGGMTPLWAAVAMPVSSLLLILLVGVSLGRRPRRARAAPAAAPSSPLVTAEVPS